MAAKTLNIEVGKRLVKICVSEKKGKAYSVSESFSFPTPDGCVLDGQVVSEVAMGDKLMGELSNHDIKASEVVFSIASTKVATREVTMPTVKDDQVKAIVETNAAEYLPIDVSKYTMDAIVLERDEQEMRVLVIAVPNAMINSYIALADYTGLTITALDFSGNSQFQVLKGISGEGVNMFVSVDTDSTLVTFVEGGNLLLQRFLPVGGDEMICRYMGIKSMEDNEYLTALGEVSETAEDVGITVRESKPVEEETESGEAVIENHDDDEEDDGAAEIEEEGYTPAPVVRPQRYMDNDTGIRYPELDDSLTKIVGGIIRSVDFFLGSAHTDKQVEKIVIMGSCAHLMGLKKRLFESLGADTYWLEEVKDLQKLANSIDDISIYIDCLGARVAPLDLLPKDYVSRTSSKKSGGLINKDNFGIVAIIACAVIALGLTGYSVGMNLIKTNKDKELDEQIAQYQEAKQNYDDYIVYKAGDTDLQSFVDGYITNNAHVIEFLEELEMRMPADISIMTANFNNEGVSMNITVPGFDEAANVIRAFRSFNSVGEISCSGLTSTGGENSNGQVSFTITFEYKVEETEAPVTEAATEAVIE